jgi:chromosome segregation protein
MKSLRDLVDDKKSTFKSFSTESNILLKQIDSLSLELFDIKSSSEKLDFLKRRLSEKKSLIDDLNKKEIELEKKTHTNEYEIEKQNKIIENISRLDVCPLCKSKVTPEHLKNIKNEIKPQVESLKSQIEKADKELNEIYSNRDILKSDIEQIADEISKRESDLIKISSINEKKEQLKSLQNKLNLSKEELDKLEKRLKNLERGFDENSNIEQKYETLKIELQEVSLRSAETVDTEVSFKQREVERSKIALKQIIREETDLLEDMSSVKEELEKKEEMLDNKRKQEEELSKRFQKMIQERDDLQKRIRELESNLSLERNKVYNTEQESNNLKIDLAKVNAEIENLETEMLAFPNIELVGGSKEVLSDKLARTEEILSRIGSVNLRSLEVYDAVKKEYESVQERVDIIEKEKQSIMKIIHEIDVKKKKSFTKTFDSLNEIFARNFSQLSTKGQVTLELENKKDPFEGGVGIVVKTGHGKYFDVKSLSGGEQALVALSLIFAIQELKPYSFYILDEIDAALDKKNSERLAGLLKKYMRQGQYIVITHNDEVISNATNLYGVSMHDGVSKVVSLKV